MKILQQIELSTNSEDKIVIEARVYGMFALHRPFVGSRRDGWRITHVPSGVCAISSWATDTSFPVWMKMAKAMSNNEFMYELGDGTVEGIRSHLTQMAKLIVRSGDEVGFPVNSKIRFQAEKAAS